MMRLGWLLEHRTGRRAEGGDGRATGPSRPRIPAIFNLIGALGLALAVTGCEALLDSAPPEDEIAVPEVDPPADALEARLRERGRDVAAYMILDGPAMRGEAEEGSARDFSHILHPGWCYKVIALGGEGVRDLDLRVYDANGVLSQRDVTQDPQPYIGQMRPICPGASGAYRLEVRLVSGSGPFVAQFYRSI